MKRAATLMACIQLAAAAASPARSADLERPTEPGTADALRSIGPRLPLIIAGRAAAIDGRTLWFPEHAVQVQLADIDSCELPQWSYDPHLHRGSSHPKPVPCGPLAKAWLKRTVGSKRITCTISSSNGPRAFIGVCTARGRDLAREMLRVGWARVPAASTFRFDYLAWQRHAMSARYGMWATYVLDMEEWRREAVDKTLSRRPLADFNLLIDRGSEISPPFIDAKRRPHRTDR